MSIEKFDLLISKQISNKQVSELVIEAEKDAILKTAIEGYITEHILDDTKDITPQIELLAKPLAYHKQVIEGTPSPPSHPPGASTSKIVKLSLGVAGAVAVTYLFVVFLIPSWQTVPKIISQNKPSADTSSFLNATKIPIDRHYLIDSKDAPHNSKPVKKTTKDEEPIFNEPLILESFTKLDSVGRVKSSEIKEDETSAGSLSIKSTDDNLISNTILRELLSDEELRQFNQEKIDAINAWGNGLGFSGLNLQSNDNYSTDNTITKSDQCISSLKKREQKIFDLIQKYATPLSISLSEKDIFYQVAPGYSNIIVITGKAKVNPKSDILNYKLLVNVARKMGEKDSILYFYLDK